MIKVLNFNIFYMFGVLLLFCGPSHLWAISDPQLRNILLSVDELWRGKSSEGEMSMTIKTSHYTRTLKMQFWSKGEDFFMARIEAPKKEKGTTTLKRKNEIYNYLPKIDKTIKINAAMMGGAWMGSHITNDDIVQENRLAHDFTFKLLNKETEPVWQVELLPTETAAVVWGKIISEIKMPDKIPLRQLYFDEDMKLARTMTFSDLKVVKGKNIPMLMKVEPADKKNEYTEIHYDKIDFDKDLTEQFFSLKKLKSIR